MTSKCGILYLFALTLLWNAPLAISAVSGATNSPSNAALQVYFIDVEGGQATLFVTPEGESLLIDTGWAAHEGRDADRIVQAARLAGITRLDYVLITHYHNDHAGGVAQLVARLPVGTFIDHGPNRETGDASTEHNWDEYRWVLTGDVKRLVVRVGDNLPLKGVDATVVSADGSVIEKPLGAVGAVNESCAGIAPYPADTTENERSLGVLISFHKLRILDLGDLTANKEQELMCPRNRLGRIDIFVVSHHGWNQSNSPVLVKAIRPRIAIMDNGATKGGSPDVIDTIRGAPGLEALWQLHYSEEGGRLHNTAAPYIANLSGDDAGNYLKLTAVPDGSIDVFNSPTNASAHYDAR